MGGDALYGNVVIAAIDVFGLAFILAGRGRDRLK